MKVHRILLLATSVACAFGAVVLFAAQNNEPNRRPNQVGTFMRTKLPHVHEVINAIAVEDFDSIAREAQSLELLTLEESWLVVQTDDYRRHSIDFRRACEDLREAAKTKDISAATLAYVDMTFKCIKCHKHVRGLPVPN